MTYTPITSTQTDAESPIDDNLMDTIRLNFADHEARLQLLKAYPLEWRLNGSLRNLVTVKSKYKRLDGNRIVAAQTMTAATMSLDYPGTSGTLEIDVRKYRARADLISSVISIFTGSINSITQIAPALATQSISRSTAQISTQSISLFKAAINVNSIVLLTSDATPNLVRYNLTSAPDADWKVGDTVTFASCSTGANNISAALVRVNDDGGNNVVITNASGVAQTAAAGTCTLRAYAYNYTNPVSAEFAATESCIFASHTAGASDGTKVIYAINQSGNNIIVKDSAGVIQAGVAGNVNVLRWVFTFLAAASATDFVVGESAVTATHTSGGNNSAALRITAVNSGGNNVVLYNTAGVLQGGVAGTVNTNRWVYALSADPAATFTAGQVMISTGATTPANNGSFTVKEVKRSGTNNLVVYNTAGVTQAGAVGTVTHSYMVVTLSSDLSAIYSTRSNVEILGCGASGNNGYFDVVAVNSGGNNVVVNNASGVLQTNPAGRIVTESKSLFSTRPKIVFPSSGETSYNNTVLSVQTTAAVFDVTGAVITAAEVTAGVTLGLDIVSLPSGDPTNLTVQVA